MLEKVREILASEDGGAERAIPEPAAVKEAIAETEAELEEARSRLSQLEDDHGRVLLHGTDEAVDAHEEKIASAERNVRRLEAALPPLRETLEEAGEAASERERKRKIDRAVELREEFQEANGRYWDLLEEIIPVIERMKEIDEEHRRLDVSGAPNRENVRPGADAYVGNKRPWKANILVPAGPGSPYLNTTPFKGEPNLKAEGEAAVRELEVAG